MQGPELISKYFPDLSQSQLSKINKLKELYSDWNAQINVVSRKNFEDFYLQHVLHSLSIAKFVQFEQGTRVLDLGTGGGFPGIPLAILFPESEFHLVDSIGKKIKVVKDVSEQLELKNVRASHSRVEEVKEYYDFVVTRAVAPYAKLYSWVSKKVSKENNNKIPNGIIALKGGDLSEELKELRRPVEQIKLSNFFEEDFFQTKNLVFLPKT